MVDATPSDRQLVRADRLLKPGWSEVTTLTVTPSTPDPVFVTNLALGPDDDSIFVHVTTTGSPDCPWPWSYALLTWVSSEGRELGSVKIHGPCEGEVFRIGNGLRPMERNGGIYLYPRSYNLRWVDLGNPWNLSFKFQTAATSGGSVDFGERATLVVPAVPRGNALPDFTIEGEFARLIWRLFSR